MAHAPDTSIGPQGNPSGTAPARHERRKTRGDQSFGYDDERAPDGGEAAAEDAAAPKRRESPQTARERRSHE